MLSLPAVTPAGEGSDPETDEFDDNPGEVGRESRSSKRVERMLEDGVIGVEGLLSRSMRGASTVRILVAVTSASLPTRISAPSYLVTYGC